MVLDTTLSITRELRMRARGEIRFVVCCRFLLLTFASLF